MDKYQYLHEFEYIKVGLGCDSTLPQAVQNACAEYMKDHGLSFDQDPHLEFETILCGMRYSPSISYIEYRFNVRIPRNYKDAR